LFSAKARRGLAIVPFGNLAFFDNGKQKKRAQLWTCIGVMLETIFSRSSMRVGKAWLELEVIIEEGTES
jgi:hypothetical protein